jgi:hypothetical protein
MNPIADRLVLGTSPRLSHRQTLARHIGELALGKHVKDKTRRTSASATGSSP